MLNLAVLSDESWSVCEWLAATLKERWRGKVITHYRCAFCKDIRDSKLLEPVVLYVGKDNKHLEIGDHIVCCDCIEKLYSQMEVVK